MLNSCAPGVTVVNIDNGYGAGVFAARVGARSRSGCMTVWVDASAGASGDMLLGALLGAGVPVEVLQAAVDAVAPEPVKLRAEAGHPQRPGRDPVPRRRRRLGDAPDLARHPRACSRRATLDDAVRDLALRAFERLASPRRPCTAPRRRR